jgi:hypothetical protein
MCIDAEVQHMPCRQGKHAPLPGREIVDGELTFPRRIPESGEQVMVTGVMRIRRERGGRDQPRGGCPRQVHHAQSTDADKLRHHLLLAVRLLAVRFEVVLSH